MDSILNTKPYNYNQSKIFSIIKKHNIDLHNKLIQTAKNTYERPIKIYTCLILDNIIKSDNNIKSNFYKHLSAQKSLSCQSSSEVKHRFCKAGSVVQSLNQLSQHTPEDWSFVVADFSAIFLDGPTNRFQIGEWPVISAKIKTRSRHGVCKIRTRDIWQQQHGSLWSRIVCKRRPVGQCPQDAARERPLDVQLLFCLFECERILLQLILGTRWGSFSVAIVNRHLFAKVWSHAGAHFFLRDHYVNKYCISQQLLSLEEEVELLY